MSNVADAGAAPTSDDEGVGDIALRAQRAAQKRLDEAWKICRCRLMTHVPLGTRQLFVDTIYTTRHSDWIGGTYQETGWYLIAIPLARSSRPANVWHAPVGS